MALDHQIKKMVEYYYSLELPEFNDSTSVEVERERLRKFSQKATPQMSPNIKEVHDHQLDTEYGLIRVRAFYPKQNTVKKPIVHFRGSGFVIDNFDDSNLFCAKLASHCETTVFSVDYPLAPENPFPIPVEASYQALLKIIEKAKFFDIDSSGFILVGESTGGAIAACLSQMLRDRKGPKIGALVLIYPVTDSVFTTESYKKMKEGYILTQAKMRWYLSKYFKSEKDRSILYALPMNAHDFSNLPQTLILTAQYDPLCDDGKKYADKLKEAKVPCELICYKDLIHGFFKFNGYMPIEKAFLELVEKMKRLLTHSKF